MSSEKRHRREHIGRPRRIEKPKKEEEEPEGVFGDDYSNPYDYVPFLASTPSAHGGALAVMIQIRDILEWKFRLLVPEEEIVEIIQAQGYGGSKAKQYFHRALAVQRRFGKQAIEIRNNGGVAHLPFTQRIRGARNVTPRRKALPSSKDVEDQK